MKWPATVAELAEYERVHEQTIRSEIRAGRLVARKVGGAIRIDQEAYEAYKRNSTIARSTRPRQSADRFRGRLRAVEGGRG